MMCIKTLYDGIPNGLLRDRTGGEDIGNHLERLNETNLIKRVRENFKKYEEWKTEKILG